MRLPLPSCPGQGCTMGACSCESQEYSMRKKPRRKICLNICFCFLRLTHSKTLTSYQPPTESVSMDLRQSLGRSGRGGGKPFLHYLWLRVGPTALAPGFMLSIFLKYLIESFAPVTSKKAKAKNFFLNCVFLLFWCYLFTWKEYTF